MKKYFYLHVLFFMLLSSTHAVIKSSYNNEFNSLREVKDKLEKTAKEISVLNSNLNNIEIKLGYNYRKYLQAVNERKRIENIINSEKDDLNKNELTLKEKLRETQKMLKVVLIRQIDSNKGPSDLLAQKILIDSLGSKLRDINNEIQSIGEMRKQMEDLNIRYQEFFQIETNLQSLLLSLEEEKRVIDEKFQEEIKNKTYLGSKYNQIREDIVSDKKKKVLPELSVKTSLFCLPVKSERLRYEDNGEKIFIGHNPKSPLVAPGDGKVVYTGDLTTYGKLIMIDHGAGLHSVTLGDIKVDVERGMIVKKGQVIGMTGLTGQRNQEVYFEIRKGSKIQKTSKFIEINI